MVSTPAKCPRLLSLIRLIRQGPLPCCPDAAFTPRPPPPPPPAQLPLALPERHSGSASPAGAGTWQETASLGTPNTLDQCTSPFPNESIHRGPVKGVCGSGRGGVPGPVQAPLAVGWLLLPSSLSTSLGFVTVLAVQPVGQGTRARRVSEFREGTAPAPATPRNQCEPAASPAGPVKKKRHMTMSDRPRVSSLVYANTAKRCADKVGPRARVRRKGLSTARRGRGGLLHRHVTDITRHPDTTGHTTHGPVRRGAHTQMGP